jgi:hypothetical protein
VDGTDVGAYWYGLLLPIDKEGAYGAEMCRHFFESMTLLMTLTLTTAVNCLATLPKKEEKKKTLPLSPDTTVNT